MDEPNHSGIQSSTLGDSSGHGVRVSVRCSRHGWRDGDRLVSSRTDLPVSNDLAGFGPRSRVTALATGLRGRTECQQTGNSGSASSGAGGRRRDLQTRGFSPFASQVGTRLRLEGAPRWAAGWFRSWSVTWAHAQDSSRAFEHLAASSRVGTFRSTPGFAFL